MRISDWSSDVCSSDLHVVVDTKAAEWRAAAPGVELLPLYRDEAWPEDIAMLRLAAGSLLPADYIDAKAASKGLELFVVSGSLEGDGARYNAGASLREPHGIAARFTATAAPTLYLTRHHLAGCALLKRYAAASPRSSRRSPDLAPQRTEERRVGK